MRTDFLKILVESSLNHHQLQCIIKYTPYLFFCNDPWKLYDFLFLPKKLEPFTYMSSVATNSVFKGLGPTQACRLYSSRRSLES